MCRTINTICLLLFTRTLIGTMASFSKKVFSAPAEKYTEMFPAFNDFNVRSVFENGKRINKLRRGKVGPLLNGEFVAHMYMYSEDDFIAVILNKENVYIIRSTMHRKVALFTTIRELPAFISLERTSGDPYVVYKRVPTEWNGFQYLTEVYDADVGNDILKITNDFKRSKAILIQKNVRRWISKRRFSKKRMYKYILTDITCLPPKSIVPCFPGGADYIAALENFYVKAHEHDNV